MPSSRVHLLPVHPQRLAVYYEHTNGTRLPGVLHLHDETGTLLASVAAGTDLAKPIFVNLDRFSRVVRASIGGGAALASVHMPPAAAGQPADWSGDVPPITPRRHTAESWAASRQPGAQ